MSNTFFQIISSSCSTLSLSLCVSVSVCLSVCLSLPLSHPLSHSLYVCGACTRASQQKFVLTALVLCFVMGYMCSSLEKQHTKEHIIVTVVEELDAVGDKVCNSVAARWLTCLPDTGSRHNAHVHALPLMSLLCFGCGSYCTSSSGAVEWGRGQGCEEEGRRKGER